MKSFTPKWWPKAPTPLEVAASELVQAEHAKLRAQTQAEWFDAEVIFNTQRIERLKIYIQEMTK
jgi:hypothetical protein